MPKKVTSEQKNVNFIKKAKSVHGDLYDYCKVNYVNAHTNVIIICKNHQLEFLQRPDAHTYQKQGCPRCGLENRKNPNQGTTQKFITSAKKKWGELYDYSKTKYVNKETKISYICPKHGEINQKPYLHLKSGCPYCSGRGISKHTNETFIALANKIHGNKYDYSRVNLVNIKSNVEIICKKGHVFSQRAGHHLHLMNGCPQCDYEKTSSRGEKEILAFISEHYDGEIKNNVRNLLGKKEIDVYLPDLKIGFEYHGMYWHVETSIGKKSHWDKANLAHSSGIKLIQIYEDEWENKKEIVKSKIRCLLGKCKRIFARKTELRKLTSYEKNSFLESSHIQGKDGSTIAHGLFYNKELVACMTFGKSRFNKKYDWELIRYSSARNTVVVGGAARLLKHFRDKNVGSIISYADRRWSSGNLYEKLGFRLDGVSDPSFSYFHVNSGQIFNRMKFQKKNLVKMPGYDKNLTEYDIMQKNGYDRIWDAGQYRFVLEG